MSDQPEQPESHQPALPRQTDEEAQLTQAELDLIVKRMSPATANMSNMPLPAPATDAELDLADPDVLEALFSGELSPPEFSMPQTSPSSFDPTAGLLTQEELDQALAGSGAPQAVQIADAPAMSPQASADELIDILIKEGELPPSSAKDSGALSPTELDALISQAAHATSGASMDSPIDSSDLDKLIGGISDEDVLSPDELASIGDGPVAGRNAETALDGSGLDEPIDPGTIEESVSLEHANIESLLADLGAEGMPDPGAAAELESYALPLAAPPRPIEPPAPVESAPQGYEEVSQDMIDALLSAAESSEARSEISSENFAAAATAPPADVPASIPLPSPPPSPAVEVSSEAVTPEPAKPAARPAKKKRGPSKLAPYRGRIAASFLAGVLGASITFALMWTNQEKRPTFADLGGQSLVDLSDSLARAREFMAQELYAAAVSELTPPLVEAPESDERAEAEFLLLEARFMLMNAPLGSPLYQELHEDIGEAVERYPAHARAPEALYWKARLYQREQLPNAALEVLDTIAKDYPGMQGLDGVLLEAGEVALEIGRPQMAAERFQQLLFEFPASPYAGETKLLLGDAYVQAGMMDDARTVYVRVAENDPDPQARADGMLRLGRMAFQAGDFARAAEELQVFLERTTTFEGNDAVYLELARAQRKIGQAEEARANLSDIINFFPLSETTPLAFVELIEVTDSLGERGDALRLAQQAAVRFPEHPEVLRSKGEMLGLTGQPFSAAEALLAAEDAGATDPELLLTAARHLRTAGMDDRAVETYARLRRDYPEVPAANIGAVESARIRYEKGEVREAIKSLDELALATSDSEQHLAVLTAQSDIYGALGWTDALAAVSREIAVAAADDETLARAAIALLEAGETQEGRLIVDRVDPARLRASTAYAMTRALGRQLLPHAPREGLDYLEQAYMAYPDERTRADDTELLRAYLAADRPAAARRVVMELAAAVREQPIDSIHLVESSIAWGDYLYERGDFRTAADAYALAVDAAAAMTFPPAEAGKDPLWAKYQRANALLQIRDVENGLTLLDEVAASDAPWAGEARAKAEYARLEQRLQSARTRAEG